MTNFIRLSLALAAADDEDSEDWVEVLVSGIWAALFMGGFIFTADATSDGLAFGIFVPVAVASIVVAYPLRDWHRRRRQLNRDRVVHPGNARLRDGWPSLLFLAAFVALVLAALAIIGGSIYLAASG